MTCKEVVEAVTEYLEETMAATERQSFDAHLAECPHCLRYLEQMRFTLAALGRLGEESVDPEVRDRLVACFRGRRGHKV